LNQHFNFGNIPKTADSKARVKELGVQLDQYTTSLVTMTAAQTKADDEMGYSPGLRTLVNGYLDLKKVADGASQAMESAMAPFDVTSAAVKFQRDQLGIKQSVAQNGITWLTSQAGIESAGTLAHDASDQARAMALTGQIGSDPRSILQATQSYFDAAAINVGLNMQQGDIVAFHAQLQRELDALPAFNVNLVPGSWAASAMQREIQRGSERQTVRW
jgi:hypothetical protein